MNITVPYSMTRSPACISVYSHFAATTLFISDKIDAIVQVCRFYAINIKIAVLEINLTTFWKLYAIKSYIEKLDVIPAKNYVIYDCNA